MLAVALERLIVRPGDLLRLRILPRPARHAFGKLPVRFPHGNHELTQRPRRLPIDCSASIMSPSSCNNVASYGDSPMAIRVAINGFGRIGRLTCRILMSRSKEFEL